MIRFRHHLGRRSQRALVCIAALAAGCTTSELPIAGPTPTGPSCLPALAARGAAVEPAPERNGPGACRMNDAVRLTRTSIPLDQPAQMTCTLAMRILDLEAQVIQPAAQRHFGRPVVRLRHFGAYSCRSRSDDARRMSQHSLGLAIDVAGFDLDGGERVSVEKHWRDPGPSGAFLRDVARGACQLFGMVLTPNTDAAHRAHFHLDLGPYRRCDA
jgi:hypothetical protein